MSLQSGQNISTESTQFQFALTSIVFNKRTNFFGMMNIAVVENENTSRTWVWIGKGDLHAALDI